MAPDQPDPNKMYGYNWVQIVKEDNQFTLGEYDDNFNPVSLTFNAVQTTKDRVSTKILVFQQRLI